MRDYIHVVDLAKSHVKSLKKIKSSEIFLTLNIGTGRGYSVLDLVEAFEKASKKKIPYKIEARRAGDVAKNYADPTLAKTKIGWKAENSLEKMCADSWNFQQKQLD